MCDGVVIDWLLGNYFDRVLKNDFIKYARDDETGEEQEETGWKYIHGDVFRFPRHANLFCAVIGTGTQLLFMVLFVFALALIGVFYRQSRALLTPRLSYMP